MNPSNQSSQVLDVAHLERQTFGDRDLEREVLGLFEEQCARLVPLMVAAGTSGERANAAHTLKGAALAVGAGEVASLCGAFEDALRDAASQARFQGLADDLEAAVREVLAAIANRRGEPA